MTDTVSGDLAGAAHLAAMDEPPYGDGRPTRRELAAEALGPPLTPITPRGWMREALTRVRGRVEDLGGMRRADTGAFWIDRDDVLALLDEELARNEDAIGTTRKPGEAR